MPVVQMQMGKTHHLIVQLLLGVVPAQQLELLRVMEVAVVVVIIIMVEAMEEQSVQEQRAKARTVVSDTLMAQLIQLVVVAAEEPQLVGA